MIMHFPGIDNLDIMQSTSACTAKVAGRIDLRRSVSDDYRTLILLQLDGESRLSSIAYDSGNVPQVADGSKVAVIYEERQLEDNSYRRPLELVLSTNGADLSMYAENWKGYFPN